MSDREDFLDWLRTALVVIDRKYLQVLAEFDGDPTDYTEFFRRELGPVFKAIFALAEGAPAWEELLPPDGPTRTWRQRTTSATDNRIPTVTGAGSRPTSGWSTRATRNSTPSSSTACPASSVAGCHTVPCWNHGPLLESAQDDGVDRDIVGLFLCSDLRRQLYTLTEDEAERLQPGP